MISERDAAIYDARKAGATMRQVADEHGVSIATVSRIVARVESERGASLQVPSFRVLIGWDDRLAEPCRVAAHSLRANAASQVNVAFLDYAAVAGLGQRVGVTQFSYRRFLVPHLCGYEGRALFVDGADMLFLGDVTELASFDMGGRPLAVVRHPPPRGQDRARADTSVMLMDCGKLRAWTPEVVASASDDRLMRLRDFNDDEIADLPAEWNVMIKVGEEPPTGAKLAHWSGIAPLCPVGSGDWIDFSGSQTWARWREMMWES